MPWYIDKELENSTIDKEFFYYCFNEWGQMRRDKYGFSGCNREEEINKIDEIINNLLLLIKEFEV